MLNNAQKIKILKSFKKQMKREFQPEQEKFNLAKKQYELAMKKFIINRISSEQNFDNDFEKASNFVFELIKDQRGKDFFDSEMVLESMIYDRLDWLEEGQFDCEEEMEGQIGKAHTVPAYLLN
jgi:hypothetical protein